jgi:hypothetical protein
MHQAVTVVAWMMGLVLVYLLLVHGSSTTSILTSGLTGGANVLKVLQGR